MTKNHTLAMRDFEGTSAKIYLDEETTGIPVTEMIIHCKAGQPTMIHASIIPSGLDALVAFSEENPLAVDIKWPQCPHCGRLYDDDNEPICADGEPDV